MNTEELVWYEFSIMTPPQSVCIFVRFTDMDSIVNFATCLWEENQLWYWNLPGQIVSLPEWITPTHWAMSEAANKTWFRYRWDKPNEKWLHKNPNNEQIL